MINKKLKKSILLDLFIEDKLWKKHTLINKERIEHVFSETLTYLNLSKHLKQIECAVFLTNDVTIRNYNKKFRGKDKTTDTLSFPVEKIDVTKPQDIRTVQGYINLGDLFFSIETILLEADVRKKNFYDHFYHLLLHSFLHLLGYEHDIAENISAMENLEIQILSKLGIQNPYE